MAIDPVSLMQIASVAIEGAMPLLPKDTQRKVLPLLAGLQITKLIDPFKSPISDAKKIPVETSSPKWDISSGGLTGGTTMFNKYMMPILDKSPTKGAIQGGAGMPDLRLW